MQGEQSSWLAQGCQVWHSTFHFWGNTSVPGKLVGVVDHPTMSVCMLSLFSCVWLFATLWTVARQAPLSMEFSRQEYWSELPCPPPGDLSYPWIEPVVFSYIGRQVLYHWCHLGSYTVSTLGIKTNFFLFFLFSLFLPISSSVSKETLWLFSWIWLLAVQLWDQRVS